METNKKAAGPCIKNNTDVNQSNAKMNEYIYISRSRSICLFVCFVALRPKSTAMVIAGRSVHLSTLFLGRLEHKRLTSNLCTYFRL